MNKKVSPALRAIIINMLAAYYKPWEVVECIKNDHDVEVTSQNIWYCKKRYDEEIRRQRVEFDRKIEVLPVTDKINRLYLRQKLIDDLLQNLWMEKYMVKDGVPVLDKHGEPIVLKLQGNHDTINRILDSMQKELEPSRHALTDPLGKESNLIFLPLEKIHGN